MEKTLRDEMAMAAMVEAMKMDAPMPSTSNKVVAWSKNFSKEEVAKKAYEQADAMLAERDKKS